MWGGPTLLAAWWLLLLCSTGSRHTGFSGCRSWALESGLEVVAHGLSCSTACGIFLDHGFKPLAGGFFPTVPPGSRDSSVFEGKRRAD